MKRTLSLLGIVFFALAPFSVSALDSPDAWQRDLLGWREKRAANLQTPEGWLALIGLEWLKEGDNSVGSATDNKIQIAKVPAHLGIVRLAKGGRMQLRAQSGGFPSGLTDDGHTAHEVILLADDNADSS